MITPQRPEIDKEEINRLVENAKRIYRDELLPKYKASHRGRYVVIDGRSGDYEIEQGDHLTFHRLKKRRPNAVTFSTRFCADPAGAVFAPYSRLPNVLRFRETYGVR